MFMPDLTREESACVSLGMGPIHSTSPWGRGKPRALKMACLESLIAETAPSKWRCLQSWPQWFILRIPPSPGLIPLHISPAPFVPRAIQHVLMGSSLASSTCGGFPRDSITNYLCRACRQVNLLLPHTVALRTFVSSCVSH